MHTSKFSINEWDGSLERERKSMLPDGNLGKHKLSEKHTLKTLQSKEAGRAVRWFEASEVGRQVRRGQLLSEEGFALSTQVGF